MIPYNFHTHSQFSDGSNPPEDYVIEAINQKFKGLGFSEHSPLPFDNTFALKREKVSEYVKVVRALKEKYEEQLSIWCSMEADYVPGMSESLEQLKIKNKLDYVIGSVHLVRKNLQDDNLWFIDGPIPEIYDQGIEDIYEGDAKKAVTAYWHQVNNMIESETFDVIGHLDKIKMHNKGRWFDENSDWYTNLVNETISLIAEKDILVEVNTRGIYKGRSDSLFPGDYILAQLKKRNIKIVLSSDAHKPNEISLYFDEALKTLQQIGFSSIWIYDKDCWFELTTLLPS